MHYYQFNIGDYKAHTAHLDPLEDIAYRRMLDWMYLHEKPLPEEVELIARAIGMRTHRECIAIVLQEFFLLGDSGYTHPRVMKEIQAFHDKKDKAKQAANARWSKAKANAMRTHSESNTKHKPLTNKQEPSNKAATRLKLVKPNYVSEQIWNDFNKQRKSKLTETALKQIIKQADLAGWTLEQALTESITRGWQSFKAEWVNRQGYNQQNQQPTKTNTEIAYGWVE